MAVLYLSTTLYIVKMKKTFISGVDLYDYNTRCHSAIQNEN